MVETRFYNVNGVKWEARFFRKAEVLPDTDFVVPKQGVWARPAGCGWDEPRFLGVSWRLVSLDADVLFLPDR
jgi:hypothetical protein